MFAEHTLDSHGFVEVIHRRRGAVGVNISNLFRIDPGVFKGHPNAACSPFPTGCGGGKVIGVAGQTIADHFTINPGAPFFCGLVLFENHNAGALPHDKTVTVLFKGPGSGLGVVIPVGERLHYCKAADPERGHRGFSAAGDHGVRIPAPNDMIGITDGMSTGGTGGN